MTNRKPEVMGKKIQYDVLTNKQEMIALDVALGKGNGEIERTRNIGASSIILWKKHHPKFIARVAAFKKEIYDAYIQKEIDYAGVLDEIITLGIKKGATPGEIIAAAREAAKMRGKYAVEKKEVDVVAKLDNEQLNKIIQAAADGTSGKGSKGAGKKKD